MGSPGGYLRCFIERSGCDSVTEGIIVCNTIHHVLVALQSEEFFSFVRIPHLARSVVTSGDESICGEEVVEETLVGDSQKGKVWHSLPVTVFIEGTVRERKYVCS